MASKRSAAVGAVAGLAGTLGAHWAVLGARWLTGDADIWLRGEHGPPFFELTLATGAYFAFLAASLARGGERAKAGAIAGSAAFWGLALPMTAATHLFSWGENSPEPTWAWVYMVLGSYGAACALGAYGAGWAAAGRRWRGGSWALAGSAGAWAADRAAQWLLAGKVDPMTPVGPYLPPALAMLSGMFWGFGIGAATPRPGVIDEANNHVGVVPVGAGQPVGSGSA